MDAVAVIPAYQSELTIGETVLAVISDPRIAEVIVVDDGSNDGTARAASVAGARVLRLPSNAGKGEALEAGMSATQSDIIVMIDADTGDSAKAALELIEPVASGRADMAIGVLPGAGKMGGFGLVSKTAGRLIQIATGWRPRAPMSGQRALRREVFEACRPLAYGFVTDAALTTDAIRRGFKVIELDIDMTHRHRGRSFSGFAHRGRQGWHVLRALVPRVLRLR
ncbi:MAG: glycosyltransferase family 2 protein [Acidimicrobiia bacterium]